jgi:hypothetical protein
MNAGQNGKGDRSRNNWGKKWYSGYDAIDWDSKKRPCPAILPSTQSPTPPKFGTPDTEGAASVP